ncbi:MAG: hypothetical protein OHK0040_12850 [bacterium]
MRYLLIVFLTIFAFATNSAFAFECKECHSKNPKMVKMHKALGYKDCFKCHFKGKKSKEELKTQMLTDEKCTPCHLKNSNN